SPARTSVNRRRKRSSGESRPSPSAGFTSVDSTPTMLYREPAPAAFATGARSAGVREERGDVSVTSERDGAVTVVTIDRPAVRSRVGAQPAAALSQAFRRFDADPEQAVAVLTGAGGAFCAGADLREVAAGRGNRVEAAGDGPMGPTRLLLSKPVIAAIE